MKTDKKTEAFYRKRRNLLGLVRELEESKIGQKIARQESDLKMESEISRMFNGTLCPVSVSRQALLYYADRLESKGIKAMPRLQLHVADIRAAAKALTLLAQRERRRCDK